MMARAKVIWCLATVSILTTACLAGCGGSEPATPQDLMVNMSDALWANDEDAYLACFRGTPEELNALKAQFRMISAARSFGEKFRDAFGDEADAPMMGADAFMPESQPTREDVLAELDFDVQETSATIRTKTATAPIGANPSGARLTKENGQWRIEAASFLPPEDLDEMITMAETMARLFDEVAEEIDKPGASLQSVQQAFMTKMMEMATREMGNQATPPSQ